MTSPDTFSCERCGAELASDDAIAIIEGLCGACRESKQGDAPRMSRPSMPFQVADDPALPSVLDELARAGGESIPDWSSERVNPSAAGQIRSAIIPPTMVPPANPAQKSRRRARDLTIGIVVGLLLTVSVTSYILISRDNPLPTLSENSSASSRPLVMKIDPPWASVKLGDTILGPADDSGRLTVTIPAGEEGRQWLEISADGFHSDRRPISALGGAEEVVVELVRKPYEVAVRTVPDQAEVWVNDKLKGFSPLTLSMLPHEQVVLAVKRRGYETVSQPLNPPARGSRLDLNLNLTPTGPLVRVETDPPGARVLAGGEPQGFSPLTFQLDSAYLGKEVVIAAAAPGYDQSETRVKMPALAIDGLEPIHFMLRRTRIEVNIETDPPGGTVTLDGKVLGVAPVVAAFDPNQTGRTVVMQASLAGSHHGRQELTIPAVGEPTHLTIPMAFNAQRVLFVMLPCDEPSAGQALIDRTVEEIHRLTAQQRFAILANLDAGLELWPGGLGTEAATSEQKVRAYDLVRSLRPSDARNVREMLTAALAFEPTTIWLMMAGEADRDELQKFSEWLRGREVAVHVVALGAADSADWLASWAARQNGTLTVLGGDGRTLAGHPGDSTD